MGTIEQNDLVMVFRAANGEMCALPVTTDLSKDGLAIIAKTADGVCVPVKVDPMVAKDQIGILARTADGKRAPVVFEVSEIDLAILSFSSRIRTTPHPYPFDTTFEINRNHWWALKRDGSEAVDWNRSIHPEWFVAPEAKFVGPIQGQTMAWTKEGFLYRCGHGTVSIAGVGTSVNCVVRHKPNGEIDTTFTNVILLGAWHQSTMVSPEFLYIAIRVAAQEVWRLKSTDGSEEYDLFPDFVDLCKDKYIDFGPDAPGNTDVLYTSDSSEFLHDDGVTHHIFSIGLTSTTRFAFRAIIGTIDAEGNATEVNQVDAPFDGPQETSRFSRTSFDRMSDGRWVVSTEGGAFVFSSSFVYITTLIEHDWTGTNWSGRIYKVRVDKHDSIYVAGFFEYAGYKDLVKFDSDYSVDESFLFGKVGDLPEPLTDYEGIANIIIQDDVITLAGQKFARDGAPFGGDSFRVVWRMFLDGSTDTSFLSDTLYFDNDASPLAPYGLDVKSGPNRHVRWPTV